MTHFRIRPGLELRPWAKQDRLSFLNLFADPEVIRYVGDGLVDPARDAELFEKVLTLQTGPTERLAFVLTVCVEGSVGGHFELKTTEDCSDDEWEIVYILSRANWGQGIGTSVVRWGQERAREHGRRMVATVDPNNSASIHILEKHGLKLRSKKDAETWVYAESES